MFKNDPIFSLKKLQKKFCSAEMMTKLNNEARGQNLLPNMALEEKLLAPP
jgi:hypothetical protein